MTDFLDHAMKTAHSHIVRIAHAGNHDMATHLAYALDAAIARSPLASSHAEVAQRIAYQARKMGVYIQMPEPV